MLTNALLPDLISLSAGSADFAQQSYSYINYGNWI